MTEQIITKRDELKGLLRKLFRSDHADLDFGIYRIMNFKRKEINEFIDHKLIEYAESEFREFSKKSTADLEGELEEDRKRIEGLLGSGVFNLASDPVKYHDVKAVQEYEEKRKQLRSMAITEEQVNDVFSHVYEFFSRYYEDGDFIPKIRYGGRDKYYVPYNGEEVLFHWATKDMYYVKTGEHFKKYSFKAGRFTVTFRLVEAELKTGNVKGEKRFFILTDEDSVSLDAESSLIEIRFNYRELSEEENKSHGTRNIQSAFVAEALDRIRPYLESSSIVDILRPKIGEDKSLLEKHLDTYVTRNTKDFFIHKDLKVFLEQELDFYIKNEVWSLDELDALSQSGTKILGAKVKAIRNISLKIIEFLSQIESFQKKLFEKKKFVLRTDYCITLNLVPEELYDEIVNNERQIAEWKELYKLDEITESTFFNTNGKKVLSKDFLKKYKFLTIDTKNFSIEFKDQLLNKIESIDGILNGVIIKGENYQSLNLIYEKYENNIKSIYIDPPYNTGSDDFIYKDNYQNSSWISLLYDRLDLSKNFLNENGNILINIGEEENSELKLLMDSIYKKNNFIGKLIWQKRKGGGNDSFFVAIDHDYILLYTKNFEKNKNKWRIPYEEEYLKRYKEVDEKGQFYWDTLSRPGLNNPIIYDVKCPDGTLIKSGEWQISEKEFLKGLDEGDIKISKNKDGRWMVHHKVRQPEGRVLRSIIDIETNTDAANQMLEMFGNKKAFSSPKPIGLIKLLISLNDSLNAVYLDFFAGSGTTADAVMHLNKIDDGNRKYILLEMGDYVTELIIPRLKKRAFSIKWNNELPELDNGISHSFKYQNIEQYEDTLNNIEFRSSDGVVQKVLDSFPDYFLSYILDYETRDSSTRLSSEKFKTPFDYRIKTLSAGEERKEPVDLVETFNYLLGLQVKTIKTHHDGDRLYRAVFGEQDHEQTAVIWRDTPGLDLERDKRFIEDTILPGSAPDIIFVNGDSYVINAKSIEPEFRRLMGA